MRKVISYVQLLWWQRQRDTDDNYNHDHEEDDDDNDVDDLLYLEKNWNDAQAACQVDGGNLVSVVNIFESAFIGTLVHRNYSYWIGLSDTTVI